MVIQAVDLRNVIAISNQRTGNYEMRVMTPQDPIHGHTDPLINLSTLELFWSTNGSSQGGKSSL